MNLTINNRIILLTITLLFIKGFLSLDEYLINYETIITNGVF